MIRTNSKAMDEKIRNYVSQAAEYITYNGYTQAQKYDLTNYGELCAAIYEIFESEKFYGDSTFSTFVEWAQGLALNLFDYYYNVCAVDLLGDMLEQTQAQRAKYTESQAEELLTRLIYRSIVTNRGVHL